MLVIESASVHLGDQVTLAITQMDGAGGIQFELIYDPAHLAFVSWQSEPGADAVTNPQSGQFRYVVSSVSSLPEVLGYITLTVNGPSLLEFNNVVAGDPMGQAITLEAQDGEITIIEDTNVDFEAYWDAPPSSLGVVGTRVFVGNSADVNDGSFQQVADIAQPGNVAPFNLDANQGQRYAYAYHYDGEGDQGPNSSVVAFSTDAALPAPAGFGVRVV